MKILFLTNEVNLKSGWGVLGYYSILGAIMNGHEVTVATSWKAENVSMEGVDFRKLLLSQSDRQLKPYMIFVDVIRLFWLSRQADIIHFIIEPFFPLALHFKNKKIIFDLAGTYAVAPFKGHFQNIYTQSLKCADRIVSISNYTARRFREATGYGGDIEIATLGVHSEKFIQDRTVEKEPSILFVGHIKPRKGLIYLIDAFVLIADIFPEVKLNIIGPTGDGPYERMCRDKINEHNLSDRVIFHGMVDDASLIKWYQKSVVNVLPSINEQGHFEGFGLIHLEANACGVPSIGSFDCGNEDAILDGKTGWLCPQKDSCALAEKLREVFESWHSEVYNDLAAFCRVFAEKNDWVSYYKKINDIYLNI